MCCAWLECVVGGRGTFVLDGTELLVAVLGVLDRLHHRAKVVPLLLDLGGDHGAVKCCICTHTFLSSRLRASLPASESF